MYNKFEHFVEHTPIAMNSSSPQNGVVAITVHKEILRFLHDTIYLNTVEPHYEDLGSMKITLL